MDTKDYQKWAMTLDRKDYSECLERLKDIHAIRLNHAVYGLTTETGELTDVVKRYVQYGTPIDWTNVKEEIGDILWYCALACDAAGTTIEESMQKNYEKLSKRYGKEFTEQSAINRNLEAERKILES